MSAKDEIINIITNATDSQIKQIFEAFVQFQKDKELKLNPDSQFCELLAKIE